MDEKKAMAKCRLLANENCELGDQVSESRLSHIKAQADEVQASFLEVTRDMQGTKMLTSIVLISLS